MNDFEIVDILLVEDNPSDAELTLRALKRKNLANKVFVVEDGQEAVDFLLCKGNYISRTLKFSPKVVLLDLNLPRLNGLDVLRIIKMAEPTAMVPVVVLTSSQEEYDVKEAYKLGANNYVVKPVEFNQFIESLSTIGNYWLRVNQTLRN